MQFKHPEILYALFLLLIPIFIHLFQLRRFQKVNFTNVAFLKKVVIETRKSSQLKKWLTLLMRLAALACIIIAFAQPFSAPKTALNNDKETVVYLDNSFSMQLKGPQGPLLERASQDLFNLNNGSGKLSWFTNNSERQNSAPQDFKNEVLSIEYSPNQLTPQQVLLKANQLFSNENGALKQLIYISDFQENGEFPDLPEKLTVNAVPLKATKLSNIALDSVFVASRNATSTQLKVSATSHGETPPETSISLYNGEKLMAKTAINFSGNSTGSASFDIENTKDFIGKLQIVDPNLAFDNTLFFSINKPKKIKVLAINEAEGEFLQRLFKKEEFQFIQQTIKTLNYSEISEQNFIVLNELGEIPSSLATVLQSFCDNGGSLLIIPASDAELKSYNKLLQQNALGLLIKEIPQEKKITKIQFSHPLYQDVFEKEVANFQYPKVNSFYKLSTDAAPVLLFEDNNPFLIASGKTYLFTASLNANNSNFQSSPLVVPSLYNMAIQSLALPKLYYEIGEQNEIAIPAKLGSDEILTIKDSLMEFIPRQQSRANHVLITTLDEPVYSGNYQIFNDETPLMGISYNYSRKESDLEYSNPENWKNVQVFESIDELYETLREVNRISSFWKWFAIFALLFLIFEMLILKLLK